MEFELLNYVWRKELQASPAVSVENKVVNDMGWQVTISILICWLSILQYTTGTYESNLLFQDHVWKQQ